MKSARIGAFCCAAGGRGRRWAPTAITPNARAEYGEKRLRGWAVV